MFTKGALVATVAGVLALAGCAQAGISPDDAYKIGCPALDAAAASGSMAGGVAKAGLEQLAASGAVTGETKQWVEAAVRFLQDPKTLSPANRKLIKDGCAAHGYTLQNLG